MTATIIHVLASITIMQEKKDFYKSGCFTNIKAAISCFKATISCFVSYPPELLMTLLTTGNIETIHHCNHNVIIASIKIKNFIIVY